MTSRTLVLLRHAKAERPDGPADIDRSLTGRGRADAAAAGAWLSANDHIPDLVICSPAKRTRQTWHEIAVAIAEAGPTSAPHVTYDRDVYDGGTADLLAVVRAVDDRFQTMLLIGHNPSVSMLSAQLDPRADGDSDGLRTAGMAVHEVPGPWAGLGSGGAPRTTEYTARS